MHKKSATLSPLDHKLFFLLRMGILGCFVGHGMWGVITKADWLPFFDVFFIPHNTAYLIMPVIGVVDIAVGVLAFAYPCRAVFAWAAFWTLFTALLRPSAGMGMSEFYERAGNYGLPLAGLVLYGWPRSLSSAFQKLEARPLDDQDLQHLNWTLRWTIGLLLIGHGGFGFFVQKQMLLDHFAAVNIFLNKTQLQMFGAFEMALGCLVIIRPKLPGLLIFVLLFKLASESLYPIAGSWVDIWETIERMGDYIAPIMLWMLLREGKELLSLPKREREFHRVLHS